MKYTINAQLKLPEYTDLVDIAELNENFTKIDGHLGILVTEDGGVHGLRYNTKTKQLEYCAINENGTLAWHPAAELTGAVSAHDKANDAHSDIRDLIEGLTTGKVNVADIINDLTTSAINKPLSAKMGVELKQLMGEIENTLDEFPDWLTETDVNEVKGATIWGEQNIGFTGKSAYLSNYGDGLPVGMGTAYDVYWQGVRYQCTLKEYGNAEYYYLGNGSLISGIGAANTGEPFCLCSALGGGQTLTMILKNTTKSEIITLEVTYTSLLEIVPAKMPEEYLPDCVATKQYVDNLIGSILNGAS